MKVSALSLCLLPTSSGFSLNNWKSAVKAAPRKPELQLAAEVVSNESVGKVKTVLPEMSQSLPFLKRPTALTLELAGDVGFDPFGFSSTPEELLSYREAEIKHARLAMLAAAGWPLSEVLDKKIAGLMGLVPILDSSDRVPSVLNGGLEKISPLYWISCLMAAAVIDIYGFNKLQANQGYFPGNLGWDPLGLYPKDEDGKKWMQLAEIKNGRLAMIAVFGFAIQELVSKTGVIDETPLFFFPIDETFKMYTNSGYLH